GLLQDNFNDTIGQVPWLGNIPVLGALFRSADFQRQQSELVIIITPHLVTPSNSDTLAMPTDRIRPPSEKDFFLFGHDVAKVPKGGPSEVAKQDFSGSYGYVMN
ncbi:general secretion pathway protein, partial [Thioclava sp. BHET1]